MGAYFVVGIGTGVGKTFTTCALLEGARASGQATYGFKPVISGWTEDSGSDTALIRQAANSPLPVEQLSPWRFSAPLSPHRAAAIEGKTLDTDALIAWTNEQLSLLTSNGQPLMLFETVGGVMVPLTDRVTTLDWMAAVGLPVILVAGSYLGAISHTLTSLAVLRACGLNVAALVLTETPGSSVTLAEAEAGLAPFISDIPLRVVQPLVSSWREADAIQSLGELL